MALTVETSGTQTATVGTEHTLATLTGTKYYSGYIDLANLAAGDRVEIRVKVKVLSGGTLRTVIYDVYAGDSVALGLDQIWYLPPMPSNVEWVVTIKQTHGTGRQFPYKFYSS